LSEGYNVVATSRDANPKFTTSVNLILLDGDISKQQTAAHAVEAAINNFGAIDVLVNNAGIFLTKPLLTSQPRTSTPFSPRICLDSSTALSAR